MKASTIDESLYYRLGDVLSRNSVYNFIVGGRGIGKTFAAKEWCIKDYLKTGGQFIYLRRYNTELKTRDTWFADIAWKFPEYRFRVQGSTAQVSRAPVDGKPKWETMGYFIALATAQTKKSVPYPLVTKIIYDEFIIEKGVMHYIAGEAKVMLDFFSTVDRYKDKTRVLFLANSVSIMNPYFMEYDIEPRKGVEWVTTHGGFITVHLPNDAKFSSAVLKTKFGQFIANTEYAEFSIGNVFFDNHDAFIENKPGSALYQCTIETDKGTFSVWRGWRDGLVIFWAQEKRPKTEMLYTVVPEWLTEGKYILHYSDKLAQILRGHLKAGRVYFDKPKTRNAFIQLFKR